MVNVTEQPPPHLIKSPAPQRHNSWQEGPGWTGEKAGDEERSVILGIAQRDSDVHGEARGGSNNHSKAGYLTF